VHDRVEACDGPRTRLVGESVHANPVLGEVDDESATVPVNPFTGATVMVGVVAVPTFAVVLAGLAVTVKSVTV
jgi:hypothetical protein